LRCNGAQFLRCAPLAEMNRKYACFKPFQLWRGRPPSAHASQLSARRFLAAITRRTEPRAKYGHRLTIRASARGAGGGCVVEIEPEILASRRSRAAALFQRLALALSQPTRPQRGGRGGARQPIRSHSLTHFVRVGPQLVRIPSAGDLAAAAALPANNSHKSLRADV